MREKTKWLEKHAPLGIDVTTEFGLYMLGVVMATLLSAFCFFADYSNALNDLYTYRGKKRVLIEGAIMQDFTVLSDRLGDFASLVCVASLLMIMVHYMYHYQGSKMMYLMKRLPNKWDVHRRCWTLPVTGAVLMAVWAFVLKMIFYAVYILCTPSQCLPL